MHCSSTTAHGSGGIYCVFVYMNERINHILLPICITLVLQFSSWNNLRESISVSDASIVIQNISAILFRSIQNVIV